MVLLATLVLCASPLEASAASLTPHLEGALLDEPRSESGLLAAQPGVRARPAVMFSVGVFTAMFAAPTSLLLGRWMGSWSNSLIGAALPALLVPLLLPPIAVALAEWWTADDEAPGLYRKLVPILATVGVQLAVMAVCVLGGLSSGNAQGVAGFTAVDAVFLPAAATLSLRLTAQEPALIAPVLATTF